jgi:uncharacterized protein YjbI with pentapeptide repeats
MAGESAEKLPKRRAEDCPWYLLATLYGVPGDDDRELQAKNRVTWNRLMAAQLGDNDRAALIGKARHSTEELTPLSPSERMDVETVFADRRGLNSSVLFPCPESEDAPVSIDFSNVMFDRTFIAAHFHFAENVDFSRATFSGGARFGMATFSGSTSFDGATFSGGSYFDSATFYRGAHFIGATFSGVALFRCVGFASDILFENATFSDSVLFIEAAFSGPAMFSKANFSGDVLFFGSTFSGGVSFAGSTFRSEASFTNAKMRSGTSFEGTTFEVRPPEFFGTKLHQDTEWHGIRCPRATTQEDAKSFLRRYECLKLEMDRLKKHEDELKFFALELRSRRVLDGRWKGLPIALYGCLCKYGFSYGRPFLGLLFVAVLGTPLFLLHFGISKYENAIGVSVANLTLLAHSDSAKTSLVPRPSRHSQTRW